MNSLKTLVRAAAALALAFQVLQAQPASAQTLVVGDGTNPANVPLLCPSPTAPTGPTMLDAFTLQATGAADVVTRITVQLAPAGAWVNVATVEITNAGGTTVYGSAIPGGDQVNVYVTGIAPNVAAGAVSYSVRITPKDRLAMPAPNIGQQYATTGTVVSIASNNPRTYNDTSSATVTIDNLAPSDVTFTSVASTPTSITLNWASAAQVVVLMKQAGPVTEVPIEGKSYVPGVFETSTTTTVACGGTTPVATCPIPGTLTAGTAYYFRVFAVDPCGNYSLGAPIGPLFPGGSSEGSTIAGTVAPVVAIINPMNAATVTSTGAGFRVQVRAFSRTTTLGVAQPINAIRLKAAAAGNTFTTNCGSTTDYPIALNINPNYPSSTSGATDRHGVYEANVIIAKGPYILRACASSAGGNVLSGPVGISVNDGSAGSPRGDGNLLVRDNGAQLCSDCHAIATHASETVGNAYGSWYAACRDCHTPHSTSNVELIRKQITPPGYRSQQPPRDVVFYDRTTGYAATAYANPAGTGVCQVCHTATLYYRNDGTLAGGHNPTQACTTCHAHTKGLKAACTDCHGDKTGTYLAIAGADTNAASAPPTAADKVTATGVKVGAHQAHVNRATYRANPLACADCHPSPNVHNGTADAAWSVLATNTIINGFSYSVAPTPGAGNNAFGAGWESPTPTCTNACHGANIPSNASKPAPTWNPATVINCTSCHGAPPPLTATANQTHPRNSNCSLCHGSGYAIGGLTVAAKATHINGTLNRTTSGCTSCHGDIGVSGVTLALNTAAAAPGQTGSANSMDTTGSTNTLSPGVGAHIHHLTTTIYRTAVACAECHALPPSDTDTAHATGVSTSGSRATLTFGNLAKGVGVAFNNEAVSPAYTGSTSAAYGATAGSCSSVYCHGQFKNGAKATISWTATSITCNSCHGRAAGATATEPTGNHPYPAATCGNCHSGYTGTTVNLASHVNGALEVTLTCTSCHGASGRTPVASANQLDGYGASLVKAAPPIDATSGALSGNLVGAHLAHVNQGSTAPPLSSALICANCHAGQVWTTAPHATPANPVLWGNIATDNGVVTPTVYNPATKTCSNTYCHGNWKYGNGAASISWGNGTVVKQSCNSCHGQSLAAPQPTYPHPQNTACVTCHGTGYSTTTVAAATHVDALTTKVVSGCTSCHGELGASNVTLANLTVKAAPGATGSSTNSYDTVGLASGNVIGAHEAHLVGAGIGSTPRWRSAPIACIECHVLPLTDTDTAHATGVGTGGARATIAFGNLATDTVFEIKPAASYTRYTCSNTYCHDPKSADTQTLPVAQVNAPAWNVGTAQAQCGSCHGLPPLTSSHPANTACGSCHPGYTATAPTAASTISAVNPNLHINGVLDGGESSGGSACLNCHKTDATTGAKYNLMVADTTVYHHVLSAETGAFVTYPTTSTGRACLQCHADHDVFNPTLNPGNTLGRGANLRYTIGTAPTKVAPASGNYSNTDFVSTSTFGICISCHTAGITKAAGQKSDGTTVTAAINGIDFGASAHNYTVTGNITTGGTPILANCMKCHSDAPVGTTYPEKQSGTYKFALHTSVDRRLLNPLGIAAPADNMEEKFCYRCHSASTDVSPGGGPSKTTTANDWFGAVTTMTGGSTSLYAAMQEGTSGGVAPTQSASTLYFRNVATVNTPDGPAPAAYILASGTYAGTTTFSQYDMALASGTTGVTRTNTSGTTTARYLRFGQFVSPPVAATVTIPSGSTFQIKTRAQISVAGDTENERFQIWARTAAGVNTAFNTVVQQQATALTTTATNRTYSFVTNTAITLNPGDGLILEIEALKSSTTSSTVTENYGNFPTDAASLVLPVSITFQSGVAGTTSGRHDVGAYSGIHMPSPTDEHLQRIAANKHVSCTDCHNPHEAKREGLVASVASAASTSNTTINDTTKAWTANQWIGYTVFVTGTGTGNGAGQVRATITANTATQLTFAPGLMNYATTPVALPPPAGSSYRIHLDGRSGLVTAAAAVGATTLSATPSPVFPTNAYAGGMVRIVEGAGAGQVRSVVSNTGTVLTVTPGWTTALTTASRYSITPPPGALTGASGVDVPTWNATNWTASTFSPAAGSTTALPGSNAQWQVCFKCHSSANTGYLTWGGTGTWGSAANTNNWTDVALEFNPSNKSYHPVVGALPAAQPTVGSNQLNATQLINGWTPGSVMTCTDCHNADAVSPAAQGPHGSAIKYMLAGVNKAWPYTVAGATSGTLFYIPTADAGIGTNNGLFCRNCHPLMSSTASNNLHRISGISSGQHSGSTAVTNCTGCHIRVPHGGKVSRLILTTNAPARYRVGTATSVNFSSFSKATSYTGYSVTTNIGSTCSDHSGTRTEAW